MTPSGIRIPERVFYFIACLQIKRQPVVRTGCLAWLILIFGDANDLAVNQMLKINIGICRHNV